MADKKSFRMIGITFWMATVLVTLHATVVVYAHVDGRLSLEDAPRQIASQQAKLMR